MNGGVLHVHFITYLRNHDLMAFFKGTVHLKNKNHLLKLFQTWMTFKRTQKCFKNILKNVGYQADLVNIDVHCMEKNFFFFLNNFFRVLQKKVCLTGLEQHEDEKFFFCMNYPFKTSDKNVLNLLTPPYSELDHKKWKKERKRNLLKFHYNSISFISIDGTTAVILHKSCRWKPNR